ncbi:B-cell linker protein isoform X2 [Dunckerocampus dactyliophorus]|uniref:B-cell linker protein isoform X2 n=1 Tax=Dunckerocampus dactyliophorus TaxID=161453 RepID=UPI0024059DC6|nr:B-cell linker protein isoform X2 [Dunckerocampus dactyliophorus]
MDTFGKLTTCASAKIRQFQKIAQDIKKNDGSFLSKLKRLKNKPAPEIPVRDYRDGDMVGAGDLTESDYDNDMYDNPLQEHDVKYEPPPCHKLFTRSSSSSFLRGDYIDSCRNGPKLKPRNVFKPSQEFKQLTPEQTQKDSNEENYISPDGKNDDDNYVEPAENLPTNSKISTANSIVRGRSMIRVTLPKCQPSPDFHEVPDQEDNMLILPVNRVNPMRSASIEQQATLDTEYEVCDRDDIDTDEPAVQHPPFPSKYSQRKLPKPPVRLGQDVKQRDFERKTLPRINTGSKPPPPKSLTLDIKRSKIPLQHIAFHGQTSCGESGATHQDKDTDIYAEPWFAGECDRKTADQLLFHANKDGAFMVRKSSGQAVHQPYTLVVFYKGRVYNVPIRFIHTSQKYALGKEKKGEEYFHSVSHIIKTHQTTALVLIDSKSNIKDAARLCFPTKP